MVTVSDIEDALRSKLNATEVAVVDVSGGCGQSFEVSVVSGEFEGKRLLQRHQAVNAALAHFMGDIHALSIKKTKTPAES